MYMSYMNDEKSILSLKELTLREIEYVWNRRRNRR